MKIWTTIKLKKQNNSINIMAKSLSNYLYKNGPIISIKNKYNISEDDFKNLTQYTTNRIAGILLLYLSKNNIRIKDIINKYATSDINSIIPELEGYIEK